MEANNEPYPECAKCKTLEDCPHPDVEDSLLCTPMPPDICPKPLIVMKETLKKHRVVNRFIK